MNNRMIKVDGAPVKTPSVFACDIMDNSASDAGRVQDENDTMYKNRTSIKRKISLAWNGLTCEETSAVLKAFSPEYIMVTYPDPETNTYQTREFYVGDRKTSVKSWVVNNKRYEQVSFNIIER